MDLLASLDVRDDGTIDPDDIDAVVADLLCTDVDELAPALRDPMNQIIAECASELGLTVRPLETYRDDAVERAYFRKGRNAAGAIVRPKEVVTYSPDGAHCQHCYRAAADLTHMSDPRVRAIVKRHGFACGADWPHRPDVPHVYWGTMPYSPTAQDVADFRAGNLGDVWTRYNMGAG